MMPPPHLHEIQRQRDLGLPFFLALRRSEIPTSHRKALLMIGDDRPSPIGSRGPNAFDGPRLRSWLQAMDGRQGVIGIFAGAPVLAAYAEVARAARLIPAGGLMIECGEETYLAWSHVVFAFAPTAQRLDVATDSVMDAAQRLAIAEGASPMVMQ